MAKKSSKTKTSKMPKRPEPPKGMVDVADDLLYDMEQSPPDPDEMVFRVEDDGTVTSFPATELPKDQW
jgi:hypothetical protein